MGKQKLALAILFVVLYGGGFVVTSSFKGTFHTDEPGNVMMTLNSYQSPEQIFRYAAITSQPPLDHFIRTYIWSYWGKRWEVFRQYPELYQRLLSLLWWGLPIGYFLWQLQNYSRRTQGVIILGLTLAGTSVMNQFYVAEARHYAAVAATMAAMIIVYLSDRVWLNEVKYHFLIISVLLPLLHLVSFPFYLTVVGFFLWELKREGKMTRKSWGVIFGILTVYWIGVVWMYRAISVSSSGWQNPSWRNVVENLGYANYYFFRTWGWMLEGTWLFPGYRLLPEIISHHWPGILLLISPAVVVIMAGKIKAGTEKLSLGLMGGLLLTVVWPVTFAAVIYRSNYFTGERYSIAILPVIFLGVGEVIVSYLGKRTWVVAVVAGLTLAGAMGRWGRYLPIKLETAENQIVREQPDIWRDDKNTIVFDNGVYSEAAQTLAMINKVGYKITGINCRSGFPGGEKNLNLWLATAKQPVYLWGPKQGFMETDKIKWEDEDYALYLLTEPVPGEYLCQAGSSNLTDRSDCWSRCLTSGVKSPDRRYLKYTSPHTDVFMPLPGEK